MPFNGSLLHEMMVHDEMANPMNMPPLFGIKGILFDLDGVLYIGSRAIEGAIEVVGHIRTATCQQHWDYDGV